MSYDALSRYYDRLMGDFPYDAYLAYIAPTMGQKALDLACGTGRVACALAKAGLAVHGVDASQDMLNIAVAKAREQGLTITFGREDMRRFTPSAYDLVTCVSDGLNYIPTADLGRVFGNVAACLDQEGKMVFDVSTPYKLREVLGDNLYFEDYDDLTYYWQNKWSERTQSVRLDLCFFVKEGEMYQRYDERQTQYAHTHEQIAAALAENGLFIDNRVDGDSFGKVKAGSLRWVYTVSKR
jgi:cyclopropane fatty-acyl-phospholipid synthase-like methyltransferase